MGDSGELRYLGRSRSLWDDKMRPAKAMTLPLRLWMGKMTRLRKKSLPDGVAKPSFWSCSSLKPALVDVLVRASQESGA